MHQSPEMCALKAALRLPSRIPFEFPEVPFNVQMLFPGQHAGTAVLAKRVPNSMTAKKIMAGTFFSWRLLAMPLTIVRM